MTELHDNDFMVIVYQHLKLSYEMLKRGFSPDWQERNRMLGYSNLPPDYLEVIKKGLEEDKGYIRDNTITLAGCEYLTENETMERVRKYYAEPERCGSVSLDQALEWTADRFAKRIEKFNDHD